MGKRTYKSWSTKEIDTLRELSEQGKGNKEIAEIMGRTVKSINQRKSAEKMSVSKVWTKKEEFMLREMVEQGMTVRHMALRIGKSNSAVREKKSRMGLRLSKRNLNRLNQDMRITFSKERYKEMCEDYEDRGRKRMTCEQIANKYSLSEQVLRKIARERGWTRKQATPTKPPIEFNALFNAYYEDCLSVYAMKKLFRCSERQIYNSLEEHGMAKLPKEERIKIRDEFSGRESVPKTGVKAK